MSTVEATPGPAAGMPAGKRQRLRALRLWSRLSRLSKRLIGFGAVLLVLIVGAVGLALWDLRNITLTDVQQNTAKLGLAIAEQTSRSIQAVDLVLDDLRKEFELMGVTTPEAFRTMLRNEALQKVLANRAETLPQADAFTIIDASGKLVNFSRQWPIPETDLSDRDYYRHFRTTDDPNAFISIPVQNRGNGDWTVYVVRRINGPNREFLGMVLGAIDLGYFRDFYKALTVGAGTTVTLLRRDGTALTSYPTTARIGSMLPADTPWHQVIQRGPGWIITPGVLAPGLRLVSIHPLTDYPLVVNVSVAMKEALQNWRRAALLIGTLTAVAVFCVLLLLRALTVQVTRLERSEASLAQQNARLEQARERMTRQAEELQASQARLAEESATLETTLAHMSQGLMTVDANQRVAVCNQRAIEMLDLPPDLMARDPLFSEVVAAQHAAGEFRGTKQQTLPEVGLAKVVTTAQTYERVRPNGRVIEIQSVPLATGGMVRTYTDITERRQSEEKVRYFAHHDDLTKLVNRVVFQERLQHAVEVAQSSGRSVAVLYLDLDRFKLVNDTLGHAAGDALLLQVATRLRNAVRDSDTVARMGGDEFAIIQPLVEQPAASESLARRILHVVSQPYQIDGTQCTVGVSVGIALYPNHATDVPELLRSADMALYRAKAEGRGMFCVFEAVMDARQRKMFLLEQDLRQALARGQFELAYQPIVDARTRQPLAYEALLRWRHPELGLVGPAEFIGLAERFGLIIPIGRWVIETACAEAVTWADDLTVSVNLSPMQFRDHELTGRLTEKLRRTGLPPHRLSLEVTEGLLLEDTQAVLDTMARLREIGVRFSLDDFGTAHAGLSYLRRFSFDSIKIDKSFVQDAVSQPEARAIIAAILGIGTVLKLNVIAEGVETEEQLALLLELNCTRVQGFLTGRPMPASEIGHRAPPRTVAAAE